MDQRLLLLFALVLQTGEDDIRFKGTLLHLLRLEGDDAIVCCHPDDTVLIDNRLGLRHDDGLVGGERLKAFEQSRFAVVPVDFRLTRNPDVALQVFRHRQRIARPFVHTCCRLQFQVVLQQIV